ncbi:helix-turn-helix transcriptional regulator [Morganella morganii]|nr:helix-turn-helix transcriptional regulator [Morganella morganii]HDS6885317.1 helix-turn-helix transcriptional regulator [Morganella morganii subsp. morganii]HEM7567132.1 helix-turn-helix transcriptional regulator [Serratia marcescens]EKK5378614.1 helix-turn-helix transcriptional regulator [Morganella morganii]KOO19145.1 hypothetical protein AC068_08640 [Morganella morganii]HCR3196688.1 helix-turn-helix transcriptional regulator [Morganella morganii]
MKSNQKLLCDVGVLIRTLRKEKGMSGVDLGVAIGISQQQVSRYENAKSEISITTVFNILSVFNMTPTEFFIRLYENNNNSEIESVSRYSSLCW